MKKILFIILCLTISLAGCSRQPKEYGVFIGIDSEEIHKLDRYSIVIIEPSAFSSEQIGKLHAERKTVYGYFHQQLCLIFPQDLGKGNGLQRVIATGKLNWDSEINMIHDLMYIELKTGYSDDGPAWIGYVKTSKSRKTIYFNDHAFQKAIGCYANYVDIENGDEYWISGLKKAESNRHWAGRGKILIDRRAVPEYLALIGEPKLPANLFEVVELEDCFPVERVDNVQ